jgi:hypothetical protein
MDMTSLRRTLLLTGFVVTTAASASPAERPALCFAPGTPQAKVDEAYARAAVPRDGEEVPALFQFSDGARWTFTATNGSVPNQGQAITLRWSIVPDGTALPGGMQGAGEPAAPSNLQARLNQIYGSSAVWLPIFQQVFDRWGQLTGVTYVYEPNDDGAALPGSSGDIILPNVRGDVRIGGHHIDGNSGILGYNYFPNTGDMVLDTNDSFYDIISNNSLRLRNVLAHEHGHGLGISHVCPVNQTKLMEPFVSTNFDGPQHDDILAGQRGYGDDAEANDSAGAATNLGSPAGLITLGGLSADDDADADFYKLSVPGPRVLTASLVPVGSTYLQGPQDPQSGACSAGTSFNSLVQNDLGFQVLDQNGITVLATANAQPAGSTESASVFLPSAGTYFVKTLPGGNNAVQLYTLQANPAAVAPQISVSDASIVEGNSGATNMTFTISLTQATSLDVSVRYTTADVTAVGGLDYGGGTGVATIPAGQTSVLVPVGIVGDLQGEPTETFAVNLTQPVNGTISDAQGIGTIFDNDPPAISISDASLTEGNAGTAQMTFVVSLSAASAQNVSVSYSTANGTAVSGLDYQTATGVATILAGQTSTNVGVAIIGETLSEPTETFTVNLSQPVNGTIGDAQGVGTIFDNDQTFLSVNDVSASEGDPPSAPAAMVFEVTLSNPSSSAVSVNYATTGGSATSGVDFANTVGTLTLPAGAVSGTFKVNILHDQVNEPNETFTVALNNAVNAGIADGQGVGTITNDDAPGLSVSSVLFVEPRTGTANAVFTVTLAPSVGNTVTVDYQTANGTALAGSDFTSTGGQLDFPAGTTVRTVNVPVSADAIVERSETFSLVLSNASGASISASTGSATVFDPPGGWDFSGDGLSDIVWQERTSGALALWSMNGLNRLAGKNLTPSVFSDLSWRIVGTSDFDGDAKADLLWHNDSSGQLVVWYMNGLVLRDYVFLSPVVTDTNWKVKATGDFNEDGFPDLLWRHVTTGQVVVWIMNGVTRVNFFFVDAPVVADAGWNIVGAADFNGDVRTDILWQHDVTGHLVAWFMHGLGRTSTAFLSPSAVPDPNWKVRGVADYRGDGSVDLLWRNLSSDSVVIWTMNGVTRTSVDYTVPAGTGSNAWQIFGPR